MPVLPGLVQLFLMMCREFPACEVNWMRFLSMALALLIAQFCIFADIEVNAASTGLFSQPVWLDSDRNHRRSPPQIINQLTPPLVRAGGNLPLDSDALSERQA